eukprot:m.6613 g.6613  ORF g.6613 m.6613 type:complete len:335 (-) comp4868_c0_seq1:41-1045(-)
MMAREVSMAELEQHLLSLPPGEYARSCLQAEDTTISRSRSSSSSSCCRACTLADNPLALKVYYSLRDNAEPLSPFRYAVSFHEATCTFISVHAPDERVHRTSASVTFYQVSPSFSSCAKEGDGPSPPSSGESSAPPIREEHLNISEQSLVTALPRSWAQNLEHVAAQLGKVARLATPCHLWLRPPHFSPTAIERPSLPPGYTLGCLRAEHAAYINEHWPYGRTPSTLAFIEHLIQHTANSCAFEESSGALACWALRQPYGAIGMVHTEPDHRRKGLAKVVVHHLGEMIAAQSDVVFCYITDDNVASQAMFKSLGFVKTAPVDWWHVLLPECTAE